MVINCFSELLVDVQRVFFFFKYFRIIQGMDFFRGVDVLNFLVEEVDYVNVY